MYERVIGMILGSLVQAEQDWKCGGRFFEDDGRDRERWKVKSERTCASDSLVAICSRIMCRAGKA